MSLSSIRQNYCDAFTQVKFSNNRKTKWWLKVLVAWCGLIECVSTVLICCEKHSEIVICCLRRWEALRVCRLIYWWIRNGVMHMGIYLSSGLSDWLMPEWKMDYCTCAEILYGFTLNCHWWVCRKSRRPTFSLQTRWPSFYLLWSVQTLVMGVCQIIKLINKNIQFNVYIIIYY